MKGGLFGVKSDVVRGGGFLHQNGFSLVGSSDQG